MVLELAALTEVWSTASDAAIADIVFAAARAGDVNGDGYDDLLVVDYENTYVFNPTAFVRLYFGSNEGIAPIADWVGSVTLWTDDFFTTLIAAPAGDVNADGYDDLILAVPYSLDTGAGIAFVVLGTPTGLEHEAVWSDEGAVPAAGAARSVAAAGDVNGDGFDDVIVGSWDGNSSGSYLWRGIASVYLGSPTGPSSTPVWSAGGQQDRDAFGTAVASAGDVNGDGFDDVAVGASCDQNGSFSGRIDVFLGSAAAMSSTPDWTRSSVDPDDGSCTQLGNHVATAGDVNGDGFDDLVVGAPNESRPGDFSTHEGTASVFHGSAAGLATTPSWLAVGDQVFALYGHAVASAGDVDGDGYDDVVVGAPYQDDVTVFAGRAFLYRGGAAGLAAHPVWLDAGDGTGASFGTDIGPAGDVNDDDFDDVWVLAQGQLEADGTRGRVILYTGSDECTTGPDSDSDGRVDACDLCVGDDLSRDADGDGWCAFSLDGELLDCDETDADVHPATPEVCDGADSDCLGGLPREELDLDGDGILACGGDCDDTEPLIHPYTDEVCGDALDNNCDEGVDESCSTPDDGGCTCATPGRSGAWAVFALWAALLILRSPRPVRADS